MGPTKLKDNIFESPQDGCDILLSNIEVLASTLNSFQATGSLTHINENILCFVAFGQMK